MSNIKPEEDKSRAQNSQDKVAHLVNLPSLPALLMDALQTTTANQSLTVLAEKVGQDPPMVARILRIVNSPFYGMQREIGSLREAVVLLGLNRVRDLLLSACFINVFPAKHKNFDYPKFWQHSLAVADCARQLSAQLCLCEDLAFTAGLLHDIGKLVIVLLFPEEYKRCLLEPQPLSIADEQRAMGFDHVSIGSKVAQVWNLPVNIQEAIEQHETLPTHTGSTKSLGTVIYTANLLIHHIDQLQTVETSQQEALAYVLNFLDIPYEEANAWAVSSQKFATQILAAL